jgi:hypothetical protein
MFKNIILLGFACFYILGSIASIHPANKNLGFTNTTSTKPKDSLSFLKGLDSVPIAGKTNYSNPDMQWIDIYNANNILFDSIVNEQITTAKEVFEKLESSQNYVDLINTDDIAILPLGVKKDIGNITYSLAISKAKIYPEYTEVTAFVHIALPQSDSNGGPIELFFGADHIKISHQGGIYGDASLVLLGNMAIPINGGNALVNLQGGFDMTIGDIDALTYVTIDCEGFQELGISADILFSRNLLEPVDQNYSVISNPNVQVQGHFQTVVSDWNDILVEVDLPPFQLTKKNSQDGTGKAGLIFEVSDAVFDFSDVRNSINMQFPEGYQQYLVPGNEELWRGVYFKEFNVVLPKQFQKRESQERIKFQASQLLVDGLGVSGKFAVDHILPLHEGEASKWQFSVDHLEAHFLTNQLVGAGFNGMIVLPVTKEVTEDEIQNQNSVSQKVLSYDALIDPISNDYVLTATSNNEISFDVLKAKATLEPNSYVELRVSESKFRPKAVLHGSLAIKGNNSESDNGNPLVDFKGITFQHLQLQTENPYFQVDYLGYNGEVKFADFPVTISEIGITTNDSEASLTFGININLMESGFAGGTKLSIVGGFNENEQLHRWRFKKIEVESIAIEADLGSIQLSGLLNIKNDDPIYGNGFYGELGATFNGINVDASAWFGKKEFRYWFVDAYADLSQSPTKVYIGPAQVNGFGGGAYYKMSKQPGTYSAMVPSGQSYAPNFNTGLGFRALIGFALANENAFNGKVGFEMDFNTHFGLNRVLFFGEGHIVKAMDFKFGDKFKQKLVGMEQKINSFGENSPTMQQLKETNLVDYSKVSFPQDGLTFDVGIDANFAMEMDFSNKTFHAELEIYVNTPGGFFKGIGPKGRAGWAVFHSGPGEWYLHVGTPEDRIGLQLGLGSFNIKSASYLMIGDHLEGSPPPPAIVAEILGVDVSQLDYMRDLNALGEGRGLAFGSDFSVDTGDMTFLIFYARFQAGLGFDIMMRDYGETACKGSGQIGIDGWYANGQAYAYLQGELGIKIKLLFVKKKIPIIKAGAAVLLQAKLPNPAWFRGYLGGHFNLLGGLVKGKFRFKVELGEECEIVDGSPLGGLKVISEVNPQEGTDGVDVFTVPQAVFNMKINTPFELEDDQGVKTYRILLDEFKVIKDGNMIQGDLEWNENNDAINFISYDILPPNASLQTKVTVSFQEWKNNGWVTLSQDGKPAKESEERHFTTGEAPDYIPLTNIVYCYPVIDQHYFYQKERTSGYIKLERGQPYLFAPETDWVQFTRFTTDDNELQQNKISYDQNNKMVHFDFPVFQNQRTYSFQILSQSNEKSSSGSVSDNYVSQNFGDESTSVEVLNRKAETSAKKEEETEILAFDFTTSAYNTFAEKLAAKNTTDYYLDPIYSNVHALQLDVAPSERFSLEELVGNGYTDNKPMLVGEAILSDVYFHQKINALIYEGYPLESVFTVDRDVSVLGLPPKKGIEVLSWYVTDLESNPSYSLLDIRLPYRYNLPYYYKQDFLDIQYKIVNAYLDESSAHASKILQYEYIIDGTFPPISKGEYSVRFQYILPGNIIGTSRNFKYVNPY